MSDYRWQKISLTNYRNLKLAGLLYSSPEHSGPVVIGCHGMMGTKEGNGQALKMAEELGHRGWSTFLFDFTGVGESEGVFKELTLTRQIDDLTCAVDWCRAHGFTKIVTQGRSLGGSTVLCQAARDSRVAGACTWAAPANLRDLIIGMTEGPPYNPGNDSTSNDQVFVYLKQDFLHDLEGYDLVVCAALIAPRPLLVIHGTKDFSVSPAEAKTIYNAARQPKELVLIEEGDHQFTEHHTQVWEIFFRWLETHFSPLSGVRS
ncbi:MAG: alpha/beta hydrolase [Peptococcaceae bacterium]|nr:MAG: alpha/beta hydrolase [Peptococcaceae bacterium]